MEPDDATKGKDVFNEKSPPVELMVASYIGIKSPTTALNLVNSTNIIANRYQIMPLTSMVNYHLTYFSVARKSRYVEMAHWIEATS